MLLLKHVPHLLEEKAGMQNDGNTDDNRMYNTLTGENEFKR